MYMVEADEVEGLSEGEEIHFMRTIAASGVGSYRINDQEVSRYFSTQGLRATFLICVSLAFFY